MTLVEWLVHHSVTALTRLASALTLVALAIMAYSILVPDPLPVILAMSVGQLVGISGFGCFFLAVLIDAAKSRRRTSVPPPPPGAPGEAERDGEPEPPPSSG